MINYTENEQQLLLSREFKHYRF